MTTKSSRFAELRNNFEQNSTVPKPILLPKPHVSLNKKPPPLPQRENSVSGQLNSITNENQDDETPIKRNNISGIRKNAGAYSNVEDQEGENPETRSSLITRTNVRNVHKLANKYTNEKDREENDDKSKRPLVTSKNIKSIHRYSNEEEDQEEDNGGVKSQSLVTSESVRNIHKVADKYSNEEEEQEDNDSKSSLLVTQKNGRSIHKMANNYLNAGDQEGDNRTKPSSLINRNNVNGLKKVAGTYSNVEEDDNKVKSSPLITSRNVRNVHKIANSFSNVEDERENDSKSKPPLFTQKTIQKAVNCSSSEREQDKSQLSSLMTKNNISRLQKAASYSYEGEGDNSREISNKSRSSPLITRDNVRRAQKTASYSYEGEDYGKPPLPSRNNLNRTQKETHYSHDEDYEGSRDRSSKPINLQDFGDNVGERSNKRQPLVSRQKFQDLQNIASSIVKLDKDFSSKTSSGKKPPPLPPRQNSTPHVIAEEPLEDEDVVRSTKPPPLPPRGNINRRNTNDSSDMNRETKGRPRSARQTSYSSQLSVESPTIKRKNSINSIISNESAGSKSTNTTADSDMLYEGIDDYPDPVSRCLPIVGEGFEGYLDCSEIDFSVVDDYARETPESETVSIATLSNYLTAVWDHDLYKLRAIYVWITDNISYDCKSFYSGNIKFKGAKDVLKTRTAVCAGYSELFYDLSREVGLNVCKISGSAKGAGYEVGGPIGPGDYAHAWNGVFYEGEYLLIDCTWGAGTVSNQEFNKGFRPFYFMCSPTKFIFTHFPDKAKEQYLQPTITRPEFINQPHYKSLFFEQGLTFSRYFGCEIEVPDDNIILDIEQTLIDGNANKIVGKLDWRGQEINTFTQILSKPGPRGGLMHRIRIGCPTRGEGILKLFYMKGGENSGGQMASMKVKNLGTGTKCKRFVQLFSIPFQCSVVRPFTSSLEYTKKVRFEVILFKQNDEDSMTPEILVISPGFEKKSYLDPVIEKPNEFGAVTMTCDVMLNYKGTWNLAFQSGENYFSFIASYDVK